MKKKKKIYIFIYVYVQRRRERNASIIPEVNEPTRQYAPSDKGWEVAASLDAWKTSKNVTRKWPDRHLTIPSTFKNNDYIFSKRPSISLPFPRNFACCSQVSLPVVFHPSISRYTCPVTFLFAFLIFLKIHDEREGREIREENRAFTSGSSRSRFRKYFRTGHVCSCVCRCVGVAPFGNRGIKIVNSKSCIIIDRVVPKEDTRKSDRNVSHTPIDFPTARSWSYGCVRLCGWSVCACTSVSCIKCEETWRCERKSV